MAVVVALAGTGAPRGQRRAGAEKPNIVVLMSDDQTAASQSVMTQTQRADRRRRARRSPTTSPTGRCAARRGRPSSPASTRTTTPSSATSRRSAASTASTPPRRCRSGCSAPATTRPRSASSSTATRSCAGRRAAGLVGVARDEAHLHLLRRAAARGRPGRHLRLDQRESRQPGEPGRLLDRPLHRQGGRADQPAGAVRSALLPLRRLPRAALRRPEQARRPAAEPLRGHGEARGPPPRRASPTSRCRPRRTSTRPTSPTSPPAIAGAPPSPTTQIATTPATTAAGSSRCSRSTRASRASSTRCAANGELDNTLVIYTSDNGFFAGEHRIVQTGKNRVYEEAIRVPLLMRGPGIPQGVTVDDLAINADLAPTILDAAGATRGPRRGRPVAAQLRRSTPSAATAASS